MQSTINNLLGVSPIILGPPQNEPSVPYFPLAIVGGGPAGTGPLMAALQKGKLGSLLDDGVAIFEGSDTLVRGSLGDFAVNSDTLSNAFLEIFDNDPDSFLAGLDLDSRTIALKEFDGRSVPLPIVGEFLRAMGEHLTRIVNSFPTSRVYFKSKIHSAHEQTDGSYLLRGTRRGVPFQVRCGQLILATGGKQERDVALSEKIAGRLSLEGRFEEKTLLTNEILRDNSASDSTSKWARLLSKKKNPQAVIIGSSHSAFSAAWKLLSEESGIRFQESGIRILYRTRPKIYFGSPQEATAASYTEFGSEDVCPKTGRLYRLAGMRFDGRDLLMRIMGIGNAEPEPRVCLQSLDCVNDELENILETADLIVPAFGYRPRTIELFNRQGSPIRLRSDTGGALVDRQCRVIQECNGVRQPIKNVFAIGLASGFVPSGELGGEPSFRGQTNGYWLYQNGVGSIILQQLKGISKLN